MSQQWKSGIFGCFNDVPVCLLGWCCPCYLFGTNAEKSGAGTKMGSCVKYCLLSPCYLCCLVHKPQRQKIRGTYNLQEDPSDFLATCCCSSCGNCQEAQELKARESSGTIGATVARPPVQAQPGRK